MVYAAVSSSLPCACLNLQASLLSPNVCSSKSSGSLAWDPLQRSAMIRSSSYFSASTSLVRSRKLTGATSGENRRMRSLRASREEDSNQLPEVGNETADFKAVKISETARNVASKLISSAAKPAVVAAMIALLLAQPTEDAFAASTGGRMGGRVFSQPSAPRSKSYSGGGGGGRSYSGGYAAPPIYGSPYGFSPFYGGGYGGGLFFGPSIGFGGGGTILLAMIAFATLRAVLGFVRDRFNGEDDDRFDD